MMLNKNNNSRTDIKETLSPVLRVLAQLGGKFSFSDDEGQQFVIMRQEDLKKAISTEKQLSLPEAPERAISADEVLEKINREIALWQMQDEEEINDINQENDSSLEEDISSYAQEGSSRLPNMNNSDIKEEEPRRVRFEPIKGDLDPELQ